MLIDLIIFVVSMLHKMLGGCSNPAYEEYIKENEKL